MGAARQAKLQRRWTLWTQRADRESHAINAWLHRRALAERDGKTLPDPCPARTLQAYTGPDGVIALTHAHKPSKITLRKAGRVYVRRAPWWEWAAEGLRRLVTV